MSPDPRTGLDIEVERNKNVCTLRCSGDLTLGEGELALRNQTIGVLEAGDRFLVFNLDGVRYMDSAGVGEVVACSKRAFERNGVIKIVLPEQGPVQRVFKLTCLDRAFEIFHDQALAVDSFSG
jgi:anti-anti-sigma factor